MQIEIILFECAFHVDSADSIRSGLNAPSIQISALVWIRLLFYGGQQTRICSELLCYKTPPGEMVQWLLCYRFTME